MSADRLGPPVPARPDELSVTLTDGLTVAGPETGPFRLDPQQPGGALTVVSHAHADHLPNAAGAVVCSPVTAAVAAVRRPDAPLDRMDSDRVRLLPAGHVAGSRAALIEVDGVSVLYTGDVCVRSRDYLDGFDPPAADVLIMEATYGKPEYVFPPVADVCATAREWLAEHPDRPALLFGYAFGKAQRVLRLVARDQFERVFTTAAVRSVNEVLADRLDVSFDTAPFTDEVELAAGDALVLPSQLAGASWVDRLADRHDAVTAGFSGWAIDESYRYRRGLDRGFPLSDHADYEELLAIARAVDPELVYLNHGFTSAFAQALTRVGFDARALQAYQSTFDDF